MDFCKTNIFHRSANVSIITIRYVSRLVSANHVVALHCINSCRCTSRVTCVFCFFLFVRLGFFFSSLQMSSIREPVITLSSDSHHCLTGVEPDVFFFFYSTSTLRIYVFLDVFLLTIIVKSDYTLH